GQGRCLTLGNDEVELALRSWFPRSTTVLPPCPKQTPPPATPPPRQAPDHLLVTSGGGAWAFEKSPFEYKSDFEITRSAALDAAKAGDSTSVAEFLQQMETYAAKSKGLVTKQDLQNAKKEVYQALGKQAQKEVEEGINRGNDYFALTGVGAV